MDGSGERKEELWVYRGERKEELWMYRGEREEEMWMDRGKGRKNYGKIGGKERKNYGRIGVRGRRIIEGWWGKGGTIMDKRGKRGRIMERIGILAKLCLKKRGLRDERKWSQSRQPGRQTGAGMQSAVIGILNEEQEGGEGRLGSRSQRGLVAGGREV